MKDLFRLFIPLLLVFIIPAEKAAAQGKYLDSLSVSLKKETIDTLKTETLYQLSLGSLDSTRFKDAFMYSQMLKELSEKLKSSPDERVIYLGKIAEADFWNLRGQIANEQSNFVLALNNFFVCIALCKSINYERLLAEAYSNMASAYTSQGDYDKALENYFNSLKIDEANKDTAHIADDYINISAVLDDSGNRAQGMVYLLKSIELSKQLNDSDNLAIGMNNMGSVYEKTGDSIVDAGGDEVLSKGYYTKALAYYQEALRLHQEIGKKPGIAIACENIGSANLSLGKPAEAFEYLLRALELYKSLDLKAETSYCLNNLGKVYQQQGRMKEAEKCFLQSLALAKITGSNDFIMKSSEFLSRFYDETNRPAQALQYYKEYQKYHEKVFNQETTKKLVASQLNYEFDKQQAEAAAAHEKEIIVLESENRIQKQLRLFLFLLIGLFVIVLFFVQRAYNNKKRLAIFLAAEDSRKELLLQEVHHRINNNLQIISSLLSLQANSADDERLTVYLKQSQNRIQSLSVLHELLYQNNSSLLVEMNEYVDKVLDFHRDVASTHTAKIKIETDVKTAKFPTKIAVPLALIINELVTNSLKYAFADKSEGMIKISLQPQDEKNASWKLMVQDNGKGLGTVEGRRKASLGLRLVNIMVKQIAAAMITNEGEGAIFEITFTLPKKA